MSFDPRGRPPLPHRGQLRLPVRVLPLPPAAQPDEGAAGCSTAARCRCSRSRASTTPSSPPQQVTGATYDVQWVDHPRAGRPVRLHAGPARPDPQRHGARARRQPGLGEGRGLLLPARGTGLPARRHLLHLDPGRWRRRGADPAAGGRRLRQRVRVRSGPTTSSAAQLTCVFQSPGPLVLDLPDNITTSKHGTLVVCEDNVSDNFIRGLTRKGELFDIALNRLRSSAGCRPVQRRVRRVDVQPRRAHPVRQHPGHGRDDLRDLGTLAPDRGLTRSIRFRGEHPRREDRPARRHADHVRRDHRRPGRPGGQRGQPLRAHPAVRRARGAARDLRRRARSPSSACRATSSTARSRAARRRSPSSAPRPTASRSR